MLRDPAGVTVCASGHYLGTTTNNRAEYDGLVRGLQAARSHGVTRLEVRMDSELIVRQMTGRYRVKNEGLKEAFAQSRALVNTFDEVRFVHVRRAENAEADRLANDAMDRSHDVGDEPVSERTTGDQDTLF